MSARLAPALCKELGVKRLTMPIRKDDEVSIVRGFFNARDGKVTSVYRRKFVIHVERVSREKANGALLHGLVCCSWPPGLVVGGWMGWLPSGIGGDRAARESDQMGRPRLSFCRPTRLAPVSALERAVELGEAFMGTLLWPSVHWPLAPHRRCGWCAFCASLIVSIGLCTRSLPVL
jgi:hypothetical protein